MSLASLSRACPARGHSRQAGHSPIAKVPVCTPGDGPSRYTSLGEDAPLRLRITLVWEFNGSSVAPAGARPGPGAVLRSLIAGGRSTRVPLLYNRLLVRARVCVCARARLRACGSGLVHEPSHSDAALSVEQTLPPKPSGPFSFAATRAAPAGQSETAPYSRERFDSGAISADLPVSRRGSLQHDTRSRSSTATGQAA